MYIKTPLLFIINFFKPPFGTNTTYTQYLGCILVIETKEYDKF